jgi:hypothetical protein
MKKIFIAKAMIMLVFTASTFASGLTKPTPPIQRIDIVNMLWNTTAGSAGATKTAVTIDLSIDGINPCLSMTLPVLSTTTVLAGTGESCSTSVKFVQITPIAGASGVVYATPSALTLAPEKFSAQLIITEGTAPIFHPANGTILSQGTVTITQTSRMKN